MERRYAPATMDAAGRQLRFKLHGSESSPGEIPDEVGSHDDHVGS